MNIRTATALDQDAIREVHLAAFDESESEVISELAVSLLSTETTPLTISLVAETDGNVVGHAVFSPVTIGTDGKLQGYILAPVGVKPDSQKQRIGSQLIEDGMRRLSDMGVDILFVYGDPNYYGRFGFSAEAAARYIPPYKLEYPFGWQGIALNEAGAESASINITCVASLSDPELW